MASENPPPASVDRRAVEAVAAAIGRGVDRLTEARFRDDVAARLVAAGFEAKTEVTVPGGRLDVLARVDAARFVAVECKIGGSAAAAFDQCQRYAAACPWLAGIVLATSVRGHRRRVSDAGEATACGQALVIHFAG